MTALLALSSHVGVAILVLYTPGANKKGMGKGNWYSGGE